MFTPRSRPVSTPARAPRLGGKAFALALGMVVAVAGPARAELGGKADSIATDKQHLRVHSHAVSVGAGQTAHTLVLDNGTVVHELVNAAGKVFAITWQGSGKPDLRQLLGTHFTAFQAAHAPHGARHRRIPPQVHHSDLVIETGGHPGGFWGLAWLPGQAPAGFDPASLP